MQDSPENPPASLSEQHQSVRRALEQGVIPLVHSIDGRVFSFRLPLTGDLLQVGDFVRLATETGVLLGQIVSCEVLLQSFGEVSYDLPLPSLEVAADRRLVARPTVRVLVGEGSILAAEADDFEPRSSQQPFANATLSRAVSQEIAAYARGLHTQGGRLAVGRPRSFEDIDEAIELDPKGLRRHTLLCGQSGSGKTYSLGSHTGTAAAPHLTSDRRHRPQW